MFSGASSNFLASVWILLGLEQFQSSVNSNRDCIGSSSPRSIIGLKISRQPLSQSDAKLNPIETRSFFFSHLWRSLFDFFWFLVGSLWNCPFSDWRFWFFGFSFSNLDESRANELHRIDIWKVLIISFAFRRNCPICRHPLYGQLQQ